MGRASPHRFIGRNRLEMLEDLAKFEKAQLLLAWQLCVVN